MFDPALVLLRLEPRDSRYQRLDLVTTLQLTDVLRRAIQRVASQDLKMDALPEVLTGHSVNGAPSEKPHAAYFPLAFVGSPHASGHLMGLAVALPREEHWVEHRKEWRPVMTVLALINRLVLGRLGVWDLEPELRESPPDSLLPKLWTASPEGARVWASVTPIAFDEHPKQRDRTEYLAAVAAMIRGACLYIGLPEPPTVRITPVSAHVGAPTSREFPRLRRKDGGERRHAHAIIEFAQPVVGPVLLGAGRYRGYGLCRPLYQAAERSV